MVENGLQPNNITYNSLIDVCVRTGKMDSAWELFQKMEEHSINSDSDGPTVCNFTYSTLIKGIKGKYLA